MYFEEYLGFRPSQWLVYPPLDDWLIYNAVPVQSWESAITDKAGFHITAFRTLFALFLSFPVGILHRAVPTTLGRHLYSILTGFGLLYYAFGNEVALAVFISLVVYLLLLLWPRRAGTVSWLLTFPFLILCMERGMPRWSTGEVDISSTLMVLTLKLISLCYNRQDGARQQAREAVSADDAAMLISSVPSPVHFASYMLASGNLLAGPFNEYNDYMAFTSRRGPWAAAFQPGMRAPALASGFACFRQGIGLLVVYILLMPHFSPFKLTEDAAAAWPFVARVAFGLVSSFVCRLKFYVVWSVSESALNAAGFGFSGFADQEKSRPQFNRYINTHIWKVETCTSMAMVPKYWNTNTGVFLRRYLYERLGGGFVAMALTQVICSLWHGPSEGYLAFFVMSIMLLQSSKVIYRQEQRLPPSVVNSIPWTVLKWFIGHFQLSTYGNSFFTLRWSLFTKYWASLYWSPHLLGTTICILGAILPNPRRPKDKRTSKAANGNGQAVEPVPVTHALPAKQAAADKEL